MFSIVTLFGRDADILVPNVMLLSDKLVISTMRVLNWAKPAAGV